MLLHAYMYDQTDIWKYVVHIVKTIIANLKSNTHPRFCLFNF